MKLAPRIEIAPGANPAAAPSTFAWVDAGKRRAKVDIVTAAGRDDEAAQVEAGSLTATFDDRDGNLSPRNVMGKWYGLLSNGTPARLLLDRATDDFARTTAAGGFGTTAQGFAWQSKSSGGYLSTNGTRGVVTNPDANTAALEVLDGAGSADVEITWSTSLPVLPTGANFRSGAVVRYTNNSNYVRVFTEFAPDGTIVVWAQRVYAGSSAEIIPHTATGLTYEADNTVVTMVRADGPYIMIKCWHVGNPVPGAWVAVGTDDDLDAPGTGLMQWKASGMPATAFTAYIDNVTITNILWQGAVPEWPPRWPDKSGNDSVTPISAAGILRRLAAGSSPLVSPLRRQLTGQNPFTYFALEDSSGSLSAGSAVSRQQPAKTVDVAFANDGTLPGAATTVTLNTAATSRISARIAGKNTADGYAALWFFRLDSLPAGDAQLMEIRATGTVTRWVIGLNATAFTWKGYDRDGTLVVDNAALYGSLLPTKWTAFQLETNVSGGTVSAALIVHQVGGTTFGASSASYSGSAVTLTDFTLSAVTDNMSAAHLWFGDNDLPFVDGTFALVADGYQGEPAGDRIARLCAENGVPIWVLSGSTEPMGRQRVMKLVELLRECEAADQGVLYERGLALAFIPRVRRYNVPVAMALAWPGLFAEPPEPQDDDQRLRNQWTVTRVDGSSATVSDEDSIEREGLYDDSTELNIELDDRLPDFAGWFVGLGTAKYLRWPRISINFMKHPELIGAWLGVRIGSRITISDPPSQIAGETIDLIVEGINTTKLNIYAWTVELSCSPAQPWQIGTYDNAGRVYDVDSVTLAELDVDDTWAPLETADRFGFWSVGDVPYEILAAGQHNRVIGMSRQDSVARADGTFAMGQPATDGWYVEGGTLGTDADRAYGYGPCATATVSGGPSLIKIRNNGYRPEAAPGQVFECSAAVKRSTAGDVVMAIDYYDAGGTLLSATISTTAVAANTWAYLTVIGTAPANTASLEYGPTLTGSPANGVVMKTHNIDIRRTDVFNSRQLATLVRGIDGFAKTMPAGSPFRAANPARYGL